MTAGKATRHRPGPARTATTYAEIVRTFDHAPLASLPAYATLRQALSDLADQGESIHLNTWLAAIADIAATTPYGDICPHCPDADARTWWPHAAKRDGGHFTGTYRCTHGHTWTCTWTAT